MNFTSYKGFYHRIKPTLCLKETSSINIQGTASPLGQIKSEGKGNNSYNEREDPTVEDLDEALQDFSRSILNRIKKSRNTNKIEKEHCNFIKKSCSYEGFSV